MTVIPPPPEESETTDGAPTTDWATTWTRGTLGSLGRFQLRERLGDGGFGQVYLAYDPRLDRDVALKVLKQASPSDRVMERFFREARAVARLDHPNIVAVHDAGSDHGRCWVAYQLVSGRPLWWYRDRQRMDPVTAARIIRDLADALGHAHAMGVVHRDIKPGNVIIDDRGRPRLIDFGLARRSDLDSDLTREGVIVGTPAYMSPEQAIGMSRQADERSDVYSLGVIFYELLCGRRPQQSQNPKSSGDRDGKATEDVEVIPSARAINPAVPKALATICQKAMCPHPEDRYHSARALADAIDGWLSERDRTHGRLLLGGAVTLLSIIVVLAAILWSDSRNPRHDSINDFKGKQASIPLQEIPNEKPAGPGTRSDATAEGSLAGSEKAGALRFVGLVGTGKYHLADCGAVKGREATKLKSFESQEQAEGRNLKLCLTCAKKLEKLRQTERTGDAR